MNLHVKKICALCLVILLTGCAGDKNAQPQTNPQPPVAAPFASGAVTVKLNARPDLNTVEGMANSCTVLLLQAPDAVSLEQILNNPAMLKALFAGSGARTEDGKGILQVDRYTLMPGQFSTLHIDRAMNTRQVALVAGYYPFPDKQHRASFAIPVKHYQTGWWKPVDYADLQPLVVSVTLGSQGIVNIEKPDSAAPQSEVEALSLDGVFTSAVGGR